MKAIDAVLPPRCPVTGDIVEYNGMLAPSAWAALDFIAGPLCVCCGLPFAYDVGEGARCTACLTDQSPFSSARSVLKYNDTSRDLVLGFKHGDRLHAVKSFTPWLARAGQEMLVNADCLIPVPLHFSRLVARRYNQAAVMAFALGKSAGVPVVADGLKRTRPTRSQGHLSAAERQKNVHKAFEVNSRRIEHLKGRKIILVDDVYTTGSTIRECSATLMKAGAAEVHVLTLARVVSPAQG